MWFAWSNSRNNPFPIHISAIHTPLYPPRNNMAGWNITIFDTRYIFIHEVVFPLSCKFSREFTGDSDVFFCWQFWVKSQCFLFFDIHTYGYTHLLILKQVKKSTKNKPKLTQMKWNQPKSTQIHHFFTGFFWVPKVTWPTTVTAFMVRAEASEQSWSKPSTKRWSEKPSTIKA